MILAVDFSNYLRQMKALFSVNQLDFSYQPNEKILSNLSFEINRGKIVAILGESGSGKSTLLRLLYGLEDATNGEIIFDHTILTGPKYNLIPGHAEMKFVPQEFDLVDAIRVHENVGQSLSNFDLDLKQKTVDEALQVVDLSDYASQKTAQLSGGQRQRVALARALAANPQVLLLDEPYSHLDQPLKLRLRKKIWQWAKSRNATVVLTTHDYQDALGFADEIMVLKEGELLQKSSAETVRNSPKNEYIASLFGAYNRLNSMQMKDWFGITIDDNQHAIIYPEELAAHQEGTAFELVEVRYLGSVHWVEVEKSGKRLQFFASERPKQNHVSLKINNFRRVPKSSGRL